MILGINKGFCSIGFFKGVLLRDTNQLLVAPGDNSQSVRMFKFTKIAEILLLESTIKTYIFEALEIEKIGVRVELKQRTDLILALELINEFSNNEQLKTAFQSSTQGRQRAYNLYFTGSKNSSTRILRIEKSIPWILKGFGINDCTCGLSKRIFSCDGSHKFLV